MKRTVMSAIYAKPVLDSKHSWHFRKNLVRNPYQLTLIANWNCRGSQAAVGWPALGVERVRGSRVEAERLLLRELLRDSLRTQCETVCSFDDRQQAFWQFTLHHVFVHQP
jgi:hypothetical protein